MWTCKKSGKKERKNIQKGLTSQMTVHHISFLTFEQFAWPQYSENIFLSIFPGDGEALQLFSNGPNWSLVHANLRQIFVLSNNNRDS